MNEHESSSPESPAKEQPGEQNAAPQVGQVKIPAPSREGHAAGPAVAALDVAAMVKRLNNLMDADELPSRATFEMALADAKILIEKLRQRWIPVEWQELGGVPGPENEPAALVTWISVAQKEGVEELFRRMQKRLLVWEREKLSPEIYEKIKDWPIYTEPPPPERP